MKEQLTDHIVKQNEELQVEKEVRGEALVFRCRGAFALANHKALDRLVADMRTSPQPRVVLDLRPVGFVDSTGLGTLAMALKHCMAAKKSLALVPNQLVRDLLVSSALDRVFRQYESEDAALAAKGATS